MIPIDNPARIGPLLQRLRTAAGLSRADVVRLTGLNRNRAREAEEDIHQPRLSTVAQYARAAGYDLVFVKRGEQP